ncbi:MAG: colicin import membrane protein [Oleispira sp.]|jgi:colicin import membrane protein
MRGNTGFKKILDPQRYGLAIVVAVILHVVVIALFAIEWPKEKRQLAEPMPKNIQAKVIQIESKQVKQRKLDEQKRLKNENWKKYLADKKTANKKAAQAKAVKDKAVRDKAAKNKAAKLATKKKADNLKKAAVLKEKELKKQEEIAEQQAFEQAQEESLLEALAVEQQQRSIEKAMAEEQQARKNVAITNEIAAQIEAKISQVWSYPPSARPDMEVVVRIQLIPTGEVINVSIITSSGNEALDRSVLAAVSRAQPLPVPKDIRLFEQQFRNFIMPFRPEDAVW